MLIKNFSSLAVSPARKDALEIIEAGLEAIQAERVLADWQYDTTKFKRVSLVGFGKGSSIIAKIIEEKLGDKLTSGWVIDVENQENKSKIKYFVGTHPLPSQTNVDATRTIINELTNFQLTPEDLVLVVVCGGGSALFTDPTVSLEELRGINEKLLKSGKNIAEMNVERKKHDRVKGGGLAKILQPAKIVGLIFSDVPGNDIKTIASGPTAAEGVENILMVSNLTALSAMKKKAETLGYSTNVITDRIQGEARGVAIELLDKISKTSKKTCLLAGGETTVTAKGNGKGGRNQELVLAALKQIGNATVVSVGTDGWDNTPVAGAIGDLHTILTSREQGLDIDKYLQNNNSYSFFQKEGDFIDTGRLSMNVADLMVVLKT